VHGKIPVHSLSFSSQKVPQPIKREETTDEVEDSFVEDYMSVAPGDEKSTMFADYLTNTYMTQESLFRIHMSVLA
jgi:hypothetical protein